MAMIPEDTITEIRTRVDIVAVIGQHVQLRKAGRTPGIVYGHKEANVSVSVGSDELAHLGVPRV